MNEPNLTLLTQEEIDTLVRFLADNKEGIRNEVLSQSSIDKLIYLIQSNDARRFRLDTVGLRNDKEKGELLVKAGICDNEEQVCTLRADLNENTSYMELYAYNKENGRELKITPANYAKQHLNESDEEWGYAIMPVMFDEIADCFGLKYDRETLEKVCSMFAEKMYGDKGKTLPLAFMPSSGQLLKNLIR